LLYSERGATLLIVREPSNGLDRPADSATAVERDGVAYEPPRLRVVGTLAKLTRGVSGPSDGLGPGSALAEG